MTKHPDSDHTEANREAARRLRGETPAPTVTDKPCPNYGCGVMLLSDGVCPRCNPREIAPGPSIDGGRAA